MLGCISFNIKRSKAGAVPQEPLFAPRSWTPSSSTDREAGQQLTMIVFIDFSLITFSGFIYRCFKLQYRDNGPHKLLDEPKQLAPFRSCRRVSPTKRLKDVVC